jgi:hypothetical protein
MRHAEQLCGADGTCGDTFDELLEDSRQECLADLHEIGCNALAQDAMPNTCAPLF